MSRFTDYLASVNGKAINVDGQYGAQCWDSWSHYATNLIGVTPWQRTGTNWGGGCPQHPGYTCGLWFGFDRSGLGQWFDKIQGPPQRGDVAVWNWGSPAGPQSHVAIVVEDRGGSVYCMTQNPGPNHYASLNKTGILGYFRPKDQSFFGGGGTASGPSPSGSIPDLAAAVIRGDYGNGPDRVAALGDKYAAVQAEVNRILSGGGAAPAPEPAPAPSGGGKQRVIVAGDTLWDIAVDEYGHGAKYIDIFNASNFRSGDPSLIYPGEIAIIP
jgi:nucleoid-associated protein YgaU